MNFGGSGEVFDGLRLAGLNKIGNAELGNSANCPAEGGTRHDAVEMFGFLLGHDFHRNTPGRYHRLKQNRKNLTSVRLH